MKKSNSVDVVFKDKAEFDIQNPLIGTLLTQIQLGKSNEKAIENQLKSVPSIKSLQIAKRLERLKQYNRKNNGDDFDDDVNNNLLHPPLSPSLNLPTYHQASPSIDKDNNNIENNLNPTQKFFFGDTPQREKIATAVGEKTTAAVKKVKFSENLNKLFPKADEIFNDQKIDVDDDDLPKHEIMIPNIQTIFKELNDRKLAEELKFFEEERQWQ